MRADVVEVRVRGDGEHAAFSDVRDPLAEAHEPGARVDEQVSLPPAHEPDVATVEGKDVRFEDVRDAVVELSHLVPVLGRLDAHGSLLALSRSVRIQPSPRSA